MLRRIAAVADRDARRGCDAASAAAAGARERHGGDHRRAGGRATRQSSAAITSAGAAHYSLRLAALLAAGWPNATRSRGPPARRTSSSPADARKPAWPCARGARTRRASQASRIARAFVPAPVPTPPPSRRRSRPPSRRRTRPPSRRPTPTPTPSRIRIGRAERDIPEPRPSGEARRAGEVAGPAARRTARRAARPVPGRAHQGSADPRGARMSLLRVRAPASAPSWLRCTRPRLPAQAPVAGHRPHRAARAVPAAGTKIIVRVSRTGRGREVRPDRHPRRQAPRRRDACLVPGTADPPTARRHEPAGGSGIALPVLAFMAALAATRRCRPAPSLPRPRRRRAGAQPDPVTPRRPRPGAGARAADVVRVRRCPRRSPRPSRGRRRAAPPRPRRRPSRPHPTRSPDHRRRRPPRRPRPPAAPVAAPPAPAPPRRSPSRRRRSTTPAPGRIRRRRVDAVTLRVRGWPAPPPWPRWPAPRSARRSSATTPARRPRAPRRRRRPRRRASG